MSGGLFVQKYPCRFQSHSRNLITFMQQLTGIVELIYTGDTAFEFNLPSQSKIVKVVLQRELNNDGWILRFPFTYPDHPFEGEVIIDFITGHTSHPDCNIYFANLDEGFNLISIYIYVLFGIIRIQ